MATAEPPSSSSSSSSSSFLPLLESLEDVTTGQAEQTDAYLTLANRLSGDEGRQFLPAVERHFPRLGTAILAHISSPTAELSQAALQALGFCVYHPRVVSAVPESFVAEILSALCSLVAKSTDKNTCTRALWVISKQSFPADVVGQKAPSILGTLESVWSRGDIHSVVMEHEALNVIIRMLEQVPVQMGEGALRWAKLVLPLVVHSAAKVRLRAAAALETGMPVLMEKQMEVAAIIEPMMSTKLVPELRKLFLAKNEANVLKLWPLFVKLFGKLLHRGGPFINSLLNLEELGFRSSSPAVKKIAFIAWKSLIDNFALDPDILCSAKRVKLLMQPLTSINVRTEVLLLTKVEVWWYLVVQLGPNLAPNFEQVSVPLLQCTIGSDPPLASGASSRAAGQNGSGTPGTPKTGFNSSVNTSRMSLNSSVQMATTFPSIQLLGLEMLLHFFLGPEVIATAAKKKLSLSLEPLSHSPFSGASSFTKHAAGLTANIRDGFTNIGKDAPEALLGVLWTSLVRFVNLTIESGSKKDRHGGDVLTLMLQALQSIVVSEALPADKVLILFEATVKGIPHRVLGSAAYQVGKMDVLNGTPALFLIVLLYNSSSLCAYMEDERFFQCLQVLVGCGLSGPTSPLAFGEAVLGAIRRGAACVQNKEHLWRTWSAIVTPLTDTITQSNEVNQGDALEHNFSAVNAALMFPITHLLHGSPLPQAAQKLMLSSWSKLYRVFARCSALVVTAEENVCCEELCAKMAAAVDGDALVVPSTLNAVTSILQVMVECVDFSPFTPQFQQKLKSPHTPVNWTRKRNKVLGNLSTFQSLLVQCLEVYLGGAEASSEATGLALVAVMSALFANLALANTVRGALASLVRPLAVFYKQAAGEPPKFSSQLLGKLEKLLCDVLGCLQSRSALAYDDALLALLSPLLCACFPHRNKQLRSAAAHFWNATFANAACLTYPDEIRPVLSHVKQKTPIILPGFEAVGVPDELSGPYSSESSQLEANLSGMPVSSSAARDALLKKAEPKASKSVSTKLDFGSPKPPPRGALEDEASIDFVFIPPEAKERVLTEHQKEVKRTKRVDIPVMYNNLDASLDTTVFTQYTQSQEESLDKPAPGHADEETKEAPGKADLLTQVPQEEEDSKETQDFADPAADQQQQQEEEEEEEEEVEGIPESADVSMENAKSSDAADLDLQSPGGTSPNISGSSDLVSGTPQKPNSRRQSFITLEKYAEGKPASPSSASTFTGALRKPPSSRERSKASRKSSSQASQASTGPSSQDSASSQTDDLNPQCPVSVALDSPVRPKDCRAKGEPVRLTERLRSDPTDEENVIPDTQAQTASSQEMKPSSQEEEEEEEESDATLDYSQSSQGEPRRSGRCRVRPLLPGEDPEDREEKYKPLKRRRSGDGPKSDPATSSSPQSRRSTRSGQNPEGDGGRGRLRTRSQTDKRESGPTGSQGRSSKRVKLYSASQGFLGPDLKDSQSQGRQRPRSRATEETAAEGGEMKAAGSLGEERAAQTATCTPEDGLEDESQELAAGRPTEKDGDERKYSQTTTCLEPQDVEMEEPTEEGKQADPQTVTASSTQGGQESELLEKTSRGERASPADQEPEGGANVAKRLKKESEVKTSDDTDDGLSQDGSPVITPSSEGQAVRRSRRSKVSSEEPGDGGESKDLSGWPRPQPEAGIAGRTRRSKVQEEPSRPRRSDRYLRGRSSPASPASSKESSESESSEVKEHLLEPKRRGRTPRASLPSPLTTDSKEVTRNKGTLDQENVPELEESQATQDWQESGGLSHHEEEGNNKESRAEEEGNNKESLPEQEVNDTRAEQEVNEESRAKEEVNDDTRAEQEVNEESRAKEEVNEESRAEEEVNEESRGEEEVNEESRGEEEVNEESRGEEEVNEESRAEEEVNEESRGEEEVNEDSRAKEEVNEESRGEEEVNEESRGEEEVNEESRGEEEVNEESRAKEEVNEESRGEEEVNEDSRAEEEVNEESRAEEEVVNDDTKRSDWPGVSSPTEQKASSSPSAAVLEPVGISSDPTRDSSVSSVEEAPPKETMEALRVSGSSEEKDEEVTGTTTSEPEETLGPDGPGERAPGGWLASTMEALAVAPLELGHCAPQLEQHHGRLACVAETRPDGSGWTPREAPVVPLEDAAEDRRVEGPLFSEEAAEEAAPDDGGDATLQERESCGEGTSSASPAKQRELEALMAAEVSGSPSGGRTRGTWSPSASPSTSILKKAPKRLQEEEEEEEEEEAASPLVKSRRVSFANPIQHQELADDIDRRSPVVRTSSPRTSRGSGIPKYVTTPTKGLLSTSPSRALHSPGYKSSKKCLISKMSQEPRPVSRDSVYPSLVGCSAPVEAVLPQISSNMWSRGFGQLVRARNIKTVGDLSALTPGEIKALPIRSPKISNVKKALRSYEMQRKGRAGEELKSFEERETTSELEETGAPQNQDETSETLAEELLEERLPSATPAPDAAPGERGPAGWLASAMGALGDVGPLELAHCSPQQLVELHGRLGGAMGQVVVELQRRLSQKEAGPQRGSASEASDTLMLEDS